MKLQKYRQFKHAKRYLARESLCWAREIQRKPRSNLEVSLLDVEGLVDVKIASIVGVIKPAIRSQTSACTFDFRRFSPNSVKNCYIRSLRNVEIWR